MPSPHPTVMLLLALGLASPPALAQSGPAKPGASPGATQAVGAEALALFERVCIAALVRRQPAETVATAELAGAPRVPAERLRADGPARETAGWRVQGRTAQFTVMMLEPGSQCAIYAEGVDPQAFLDAAEQLMQRADALPGWLRQGQPQHSASPRPFGMLSYRQCRYVSDQPPVGKPPPGVPVTVPAATIVASAVNRTDGRPNTAVISTAFEMPAR